MSSENIGTPIPKWQIAALIGTPLAIGLGYMIYRNNSKSDETAEKEAAKKRAIEKNKNSESLDEGTLLQKTQMNGNANTLDSAQAFKKDGNQMFKNGKYDEAIKCYDLAIEACPETNSVDLSTFYQNRAAAYEQLKKWSAVKDDCSKALELNPKYIKALHRRARALEHTNELELCLEDVTATCILEGFQNSSTLLLADRVLKELGRQHAKEAIKTRKQLQPSKCFIRNYFLSFAQDPIKKIDVTNISEPKGFLKAKAEFDQQNYENIITYCTEEIESSESESEYKMEATLLRATFFSLEGRYPEAFADLDTVIKNEDTDNKLRVNALIKRASLNMQTENPEKSFDDFEKAVEIDPTNADIYHHRGQLFVILEQLEKASEDFDNAVKYTSSEIDHGLTKIHKLYADYRTAFTHRDQSKLIDVMQNFNNTIAKYPNCVEGYSLMAQILTEQSQYEQADQFYQKAINLDYKNSTFYVHRGLLQLQWNGDINKAIELIEKSIEIDDKCEFAYETLGTIEVQRGNLNRAIELFDKALELAKTETELCHLYSLKDAAIAQFNVNKKMNLDMSSLGALVNGGGGF